MNIPGLVAVTVLRFLLAVCFAGFGLLGIMIDGYFTPIAFSVSGVFFVTWAIVSIRWILTLRKWTRAMVEKEHGAKETPNS
jgi:membrane protein implicated in regulation of membrane protease activity